MKFTISMLAVIGIAQANFKSGSVATYEKFTHGKVKTSMKAPGKKGTVSSFYTFWDGPGFYPGGWNEIDVNVVPSIEGTPLSVNAIYGDGHNKKESHAYADDHNIDDGWHTYEMEWTTEYISFAVDGDVVRRLDRDDNDAVDFMNKEQSLRMNFWTPTFHAWGADFNPIDMPWYLLFDYVEVYNWDKDNGFDLAWRDDFNKFDQTRWHKVAGTFEGNSSVFYPQNAYVSGGNLVLKMEPNQTHHLTDGDHGHYSSDRHRLHRDLRHMEQGHMIHDAVDPDDLEHPPVLGHLEPKIHLHDKKGTGTHYEPDRKAPESHHLQAQTFEHSRHTMHRELDHAFDDQHDIEPVHFHEHAVLKAVHHEDAKGQELSLSQGGQGSHEKARTDTKTSHTGQTEKTHVDASRSQHQTSHQSHDSQKSQDQRQTQSQKQSQQQRQTKESQRSRDRSSDKQGQQTQAQSQDTKKKEEILDETPWEHHDKRMHDVDAHWWTAGHHEPSLYDRLDDHYRHGYRGGEYGGRDAYGRDAYGRDVYGRDTYGYGRYGRGAYGHGGYGGEFYGDEEEGHGHWRAVVYEAPSEHDPLVRPEQVHHQKYQQYSVPMPTHVRDPQVQHEAPKVMTQQKHQETKKAVKETEKTESKKTQPRKEKTQPRKEKTEPREAETTVISPQHAMEEKIRTDHPAHLMMHMHGHMGDHRRLEHAFDDAHDVEPVHFHESAVHHGFDHYDAHDLHHYEMEDHFHHKPVHRQTRRHDIEERPLFGDQEGLLERRHEGARGYEGTGHQGIREHMPVGHVGYGQEGIRREALGHEGVRRESVGHETLGHEARGHEGVRRESVGHETLGHEERIGREHVLRESLDDESIRHRMARAEAVLHQSRHYEGEVLPELDHHFDDAHDVEPTHFHEHAIHQAHEVGYDYGRTLGGHHESLEMPLYGERSLYREERRHEMPIHESVHHEEELPILSDFLVQEPEYHHHEETFHGRERGYHYAEPLYAQHGHLSYEVEDPKSKLEHGETFGKDKKVEDAKTGKNRKMSPRKHRDVYIEPLYAEEIDHHFERIHHDPLRHESHVPEGAKRVAADYTYEVGHDGHVHMLEDEFEPIRHSYLQ